MPSVRSFNDSSAVSLAYALGNGNAAADFSGQTFNYIPYTGEKFQMAKTPKMSTAITSDRRPSRSKNTKGSASGGVTMEFGGPQFILDMLSMTLLEDWKNVDDLDLTKGVFLLDGELKKYMCVEKTVRDGPLDTDTLYHERYYATAVSSGEIKFADGDIITLDVSTMSVGADYSEAAAGVGGLGGSIAGSKVTPLSYEPADSSNNLTSIVLKNAQGTPMEVEFSDLSISIQNNVREQSALGRQFAAGVGFGKISVTLSGEIYFFDQSVLAAHMENERLSAEFTIDTEEGVFHFVLPSLSAQTPTNNSEGENQDYKTKLTLQGERGTATIDATPYECCMAVTFIPV